MLALVLSGCLSSKTIVEPPPGSVAATPIVVAVIDTGIDAYHQVFHAGGPWPTLAEAVPVRLSTTGSYDDRVERDEEIWAGLRPGILYQFEGTGVAAVSFQQEDDPLFRFGSSHGTAVASLVRREAPDALIVAVQVNGRLCGNATCLIDPSIAAAVEWVADQPWIDIVSTSFGVPLNAPDRAEAHPEMERYLAATRRMHESGKLLVTSAGNEPTVTLPSYMHGPPWFIAVGGLQPGPRGEQAYASRGVDVAANYTDLGAVAGTLDEYRQQAGTSFACPIVSGVLARSLALLARSGEERSNPEDPPTDPTLRRTLLRSAMNHTARVVTSTDWSPTNISPSDPFEAVIEAANLPVLAPGPQLGWGYVHGGIVPDLVRDVLDPAGPPPTKSTIALWQAQYQQAREQNWG